MSTHSLDRGHDGMVCVQCFRGKDDGDLRLPCQNPRCHFYLRIPELQVRNSMSDPTTGTFCGSELAKEVGYGLNRRSSLNSDYLFGSSNTQSECCGSIWGHQPLGTHLQLPNPHKVRSQSTSVDSSKVRGFTDARKLVRSRLMSMPVCVEQFDYQSELVDDTFPSSPLSYFHQKTEEDNHGLRTPDADSGIGSPFGRPSSMLDWSDTTITTKCKTTQQSLMGTGTSSAFNMEQLAKEIAAPSKKPAKTGKSSPVQDISSLLNKFLPSAASHSTDTYSRKVFIGGLPPDIDEEEIRVFFSHFGSVTVDWPHKNHSKACIPPKGYAFLLFKDEPSVHKLLVSCSPEGDKYFIYIPTSGFTRKKVQIRPWMTADSQHIADGSQLDSRRAVFVGGVPRPLKAAELAAVMGDKYGSVAFVAIDCDGDLKYPKGAACVVFSTHASYIAAVSARFMQLNHGSLDKKIEIKPYVLDGQMCDECRGVQCNNKPAPFFCGSVTCLQYYCEYCWATIHSMPSRQNHRPLLKDIGDRTRFY